MFASAQFEEYSVRKASQWRRCVYFCHWIFLLDFMHVCQITKTAKECSKQKHAEYIHWIKGWYIAEKLVFAEESSVDYRATYQGQGWALKGQHAVRKTSFCRKKVYCVTYALSLSLFWNFPLRYLVFPAISVDGIMSMKVVEGSFNTKLFMQFINGLLDRMNLYPAWNSVIVMDNC